MSTTTTETRRAGNAYAHGDPRASPLYELYRRFRALALAKELEPSAQRLGRELIEALLRDSGRASGVLGGRVYLRRGEFFEREHQSGVDAERLSPTRLSADSRLITTVAESGWLILFVREPELEAEGGELPEGTACTWLLLGARRETLVALTLDGALPRAELAVAMATLHSLADLVERRRELSETMAQARTVQTSLLPGSLLVPAGFEAAVRSRPAEIVGGDLHDLLPGAEGGFAVAIGDATGHGLPAALQARDAVIALRMAMAEHLKLAASLGRISRVLAGSRPLGQFVSLALVEVDRDGSFVWANAGHVAPLHVAAGGARVDPLKSTGPVLGLEERLAQPYGRAFGRLEPGDLLVLFTDGIVEAVDALSEEFGTERLTRLLLAHRQSPPEETVAAVFEALDAFSGGTMQLDDQTLIVLRRTTA